MTTLKFTIDLATDCDLKITEITGYKSIQNENGFLKEDETTRTFGDYKLSEGYFIDLLTYNRYKKAPIIVLKSKLTKLNSEDINEVYDLNFNPYVYNLSQDSIYTFTRMFIISKEFYESNVSGGMFDGVTVIYSDGTNIYKETGEGLVKITVGQLAVEDKTDSTVLSSSTTFVSTCHMNLCYYKIMQSLLLEDCRSCETSKEKERDRDFLYMSLETIKYLKELGSVTEIQRIIEAVDVCGGFCKPILEKANCGCNG